ncbi:hypothetical protein GGE43_004060 [Agrobacterium tumefaciens]|uniref:Uncharacterized protein n=1 Tax=Agrobacterium radiobacter TaxID=362 RepID=A0ABR6JCK8_AGRRD|nr:hypothetical protein [Agrobacterium radiobacter]MBB4337152.1 hypothetical protein [Agrobacterium radiobacter]MBB4492600.1 hypothetical protein [Agrobacterium radiobacter]MBB4497498.1 hypothetical protein [Agrobacterium radiobacter]MBB4502591.1 hypothetical protein [Agrobacterium radiobacter]
MKSQDFCKNRTGAIPPTSDVALDNLAYIDTIPVRVLEYKCSQAVVLVLKALDNSYLMSLANSVECINVIHHQVGNIEIRGFVPWLQGQVQFTLIALQDHEADGIAVVENLLEAENLGTEILGLAHIPYGERGGNSSKTDTVIGDIVHRRASDCKVAIQSPDGAGRYGALCCLNQQDGAYKGSLA